MDIDIITRINSIIEQDWEKRMYTILGMKCVATPFVKPVPVLQLSPDFNACSESFKAEMNQWLLEMFGEEEVAYMIGNDTLVMNQATLDKIKQSIQYTWTPQLR